MKRILCFVNKEIKAGTVSGVKIMAVSEDGVIATTSASNVKYGKQKIKDKERLYKNKYPDGYKLVWLDQPELNTELKEMFKKHENKV